MEKENIHIDWEVISKSFRGELSGEERERLESWLAVSSRHRDFYRRALEGGETDVTVGVDRDVLAAKKDELMRRVRVMTGNVKPRRSLRCVWYAAAVILPLAIAVGMWVNMGGREKNMVIAQRVQPGSGRAVLELHDGRTYFLDTTRVVETGIEGNLAKAEKQSLVYTKREAEELVYNKVIVPRSGEYFVTLCDGSKVWLNADTEFEFPVNFSETIREVRLKGEAYFQVAKDCQKPFIVKSGEYQLQVYGTEFNLNTYHTDRIEAVLVKGSIGFRANAGCKEIVLQPEQLGIANTGNGKTEVLDVDVYPYIAWKNKDMVFVNERLESIMEKIERWYDVNVFFQNERLKDLRFYGDMKRYSDIREILAYLEKSSDVRFQVNGRTLIVCEK